MYVYHMLHLVVFEPALTELSRRQLHTRSMREIKQTKHPCTSYIFDMVTPTV